MRNFKIFLVLLLGLIAFFGFISSCNKDESKNTEFDNHIIDKIKKLGAPEFIFMSYDNPSGANEFRYRIGYNVNATGAVAGFH